jgi:hypothetical protein
MSTEHPAVTTNILKMLNEDAKNRNRALDPKWLDEHVDPDGIHVLDRVLLHNDVEWRCRVFVKTKGSMEPQIGWIDISMKNWEHVIEADAALTKMLEAAVEATE